MNTVFANKKSIKLDAIVFSIICSFASLLSTFPLEAKELVDTKTQVETQTELDKIIKRGTLRIIVPAKLSLAKFPRNKVSPLDDQQNLAMEFARSLGLEPKLVPIDSYSDMLPALNDGRGDMIVANLAINKENNEKLAYSVPLDQAQEVVLVRKSATDVEITKDLAGKKLAINGAPNHLKRAQNFQLRYPSIKLINHGTDLFDEQVIDLIVNGKYDATIIDHNIAKKYLDSRNDIRIAFNASAKQARAWGLRIDSKVLISAANEFLTHTKLSTQHAKSSYGDLNKIKKRGVLRVILKNNASSYFWLRDKFMGFEYELSRALAKDLGLELSVIVPPDDKSTLQWLEEGKADVAAGFLRPSSEWKHRGIAQTLSYHQTFQHIIVVKGNNSLRSAADLEGKTVVLKKSSQAWRDLEELKRVGINVKLQSAPEGMQVAEMIQKVATGEYQMTMADGQVLAIELANNVAVKSAFTFGDQISHALAIRGEDKILLRMLNRYIKREKDGSLYTRLYDKYFADNSKIAQQQESRIENYTDKKLISEYDHLVQLHSRKYGLDWRLISAQMFQESRFNPTAVSFAGATGLMQIMPRTGMSLGISELKSPEKSIQAGTKYMGKLFRRFDPALPVADRMWFTLASYNAGIGHVTDARILAKQLDLNPNRWFGNVEKAILLLSEESYFKNARYGYVRGAEPVKYVRLIKKMYANYTNIAKLDEKVSKQPLAKLTLAKLTSSKQPPAKPSFAKLEIPKPSLAKPKVAKRATPKNKKIEKTKIARLNKKPDSKVTFKTQIEIDFSAVSNVIASLNKDLNQLYSNQ